MRPSVPGNRPSYIYNGPEDNIDSGNQRGGQQYGYYQSKPRNNQRNRQFGNLSKFTYFRPIRRLISPIDDAVENVEK